MDNRLPRRKDIQILVSRLPSSSVPHRIDLCLNLFIRNVNIRRAGRNELLDQTFASLHIPSHFLCQGREKRDLAVRNRKYNLCHSLISFNAKIHLFGSTANFLLMNLQKMCQVHKLAFANSSRRAGRLGNFLRYSETTLAASSFPEEQVRASVFNRPTSS